MKTLLLTLFMTLFTSLSAQAYIMSSELKVNEQNLLEKNLVVQCRPDEVFCSELCQNPNICRIPETLCEDCVSQNSSTLQLIFTDLKSLFRSDFAVRTDVEMMYFFKNYRFMTITSDSILNMYTPQHRERLTKEFNDLCYLKSAHSAMLLVTIDQEQKLSDLVGVICQDQQQRSVTLPVKLNPEFSKKDQEFWTAIEMAVIKQIKGLQLKIEYRLQTVK